MGFNTQWPENKDTACFFRGGCCKRKHSKYQCIESDIAYN